MNLNEFTDLNDYMDVLNNLCIYITYFYSIILILDELYNIGIFTFNYTYNYNYGTATQNFNTINTIEYETNRFKTYNNINFFKTDIFNNTYFNYLITVFITLITIISCISYGIFFYYKIILNIISCKYDIDDELMSLPKKFLKCICNDCHKILPNCSINYIILLTIILIIPITYIAKLFFNYDYTPTSNTALMIIIIVLFTYIYNIYMNNINKDTTSIIKEVLIFIFFTIIFVISLIIHKNVYDTYNNPSLNSNLKDEYVMLDIYKQAPPNKPSQIPLPMFNGVNLLKTFNYVDGGDNSDVNYNQKKKLLEKYYSDKKEYEKAILEYNIKNDIYKSTIDKQKLKLEDKVDFFEITLNILGVKNKINIILIILIIILFGLYYYFNEELFLSGMIYLINVLVLITIINAITYYNTYLNKYIIYEPLSYYKNDLTVANTKLNMYFNLGNGDNFYSILNNNLSINYNINDNLSKNDIINNIKTLTNISNFNNDNIKLIISNISNYSSLNVTNNFSKNQEIDSIIYYYFATLPAITSGTGVRAEINNPLDYLFNNVINSIHIINKSNQIDNFRIVNKLNLHFSSKSYEIFINFSNYYCYIYYKLCYYKRFILELLNNNYNHNRNEFLYLYDIIEKILILLKPYKRNVFSANSNKINDNILNNNSIEKAIESLTIPINDIATKSDYYQDIIKNIKILLFTYDKSRTIIYFHIDIDTTNTLTDGISIIRAGTNTSDVYQLRINNNVLNNIKFRQVQPSISFSTKNFYEFPNKITDNNNNEIILEIKNNADFIQNVNIAFYINNRIDKTLKYKLLSNYKEDTNNNDITFTDDKTNSFDSTKFTTSTDTTNIINPATAGAAKQLFIPSKIYKKIETDPSITFKKIIFNVLYNNLINITSQFTNIDLQKLFFSSDTIINEIKFYEFKSLFKDPSSADVNYNMNNLTSFITSIANDTDISGNKNILGFIIVLYNIYNSNIDKLVSTIEYLVYMQNSNSDSSKYDNFTIFNTDNLVKNFNIIDTKIIKPKNNKDYKKNNYTNVDLINYYEKNKYLVSLILNIYSNIFSNIKNIISSIDINNLCFSSNDKYTIEKNLYSNITKYYTLSSPPLIATTSTAYIKSALFNKENRKKIIDINKQIINVFKIINFLFDNLINEVKDISKEQDEIIKNYNFYNPELYNNVKEFVKEEISINCNYVNKYNNLETSKLNLFKYNCDNVAYNFPVLLVMFVVILGEGFFIKS